jgi:hypothetical protein
MKLKDVISERWEWSGRPRSLKHVLKGIGVKLYECPTTAITKETWDIIKIVNATTDENGFPTNINLESYQRLPTWYKQATEITQQMRSDHRRAQLAKVSS